MHRTGDVERWFGDEQVAVGDPVVIQQGGNFVLALARGRRDGAHLHRRRRGRRRSDAGLLARQPRQPHPPEARRAGVRARRPACGRRSRRWSGRRCCSSATSRSIYFGGERVYYTATRRRAGRALRQPAHLRQPERRRHLHRPHVPDRGVPADPGDHADDAHVTLDSGVNTFTIVGTHAGSTTVNTGAATTASPSARSSARPPSTRARTTTSSTSAARRASGAAASSTSSATATRSRRS